MGLIAQRSQPGQTPELCHWRNHLVNVNMTTAAQQLLSGYLFALKLNDLTVGH